MKVIVFGVGALGSNLLSQLAISANDNEYVGVDYDVVEDRNLKTQLFLRPHVGLKKVMALSVCINLKNERFKYKPYSKKIESFKDIALLLSELNVDVDSEDLLVVDCFDNIESRKLIQEYGFKNLLHVGFSPSLSTEVTWGEQYTTPVGFDDSVDICENELAHSFIQLSTSLACMVILNFFTSKTKENYIIYNSKEIKKIS